MPLTHVTKVFAAKDAKLYPMLTDVAGGTTTYGTSVDVPGIRKVEITGDIEAKELRGDNTLLDQDSVWQNLKVKIEYAKLSLDAEAVIMGGTVVDAGTTPNQTATLGLTGGTTLGTFKLEAVSASADPIAGNVKFAIWKCRAASVPETGLAEEDYMTAALELVTMPRLSDGKWFDRVISETAAVLA